MMTRTPPKGPSAALATAAGLFALVGCLPDIEAPDPQLEHTHHDWDGDGYCEEEPCEPGVEPGDCNDDDPAIHPDAEEACDGLDNDCDGNPGEDEVDGDGDGYLACGDCDDNDAMAYPGAVELCDGADNDCDGVVPSDEVDEDQDGLSACDGDCDDGLSSSYIGAEEICDGEDNDCDGVLGDGENDADQDGWMSCDGDCDDNNEDVHPQAEELCDGLDNDCNGQLIPDEQDHDADGHSICDGDCDDWDANTHPQAPELCDEVDNDCDGAIDNDVTPVQWYPDTDGDGYGDPDGLVIEDCQQPNDYVQDNTDCDDTDDDINPGVYEVQCDGIDTNCDGVMHPDEMDGDGDGVTHCDGDCDPADPANFPGNTEVCDGVDNNCDNMLLPDEVDNDGDGVLICDGDCDDGNPAVHPGAPEICDGILDNNCDGDLDFDDADEDADGYAVCAGDCSDADADTYPGATEQCDGLDNDCDGSIPADEADGDWDGTRICDGDCDDGNPALNLEDMDGDGVTTCGMGDCDDYNPWTYPGAPEHCDGEDNDCDGVVAAEELDSDGDGWIACAECNDGDATIHPDADDVCGDGIDQDCDGNDSTCVTCMALEFNGNEDGIVVPGPPAFSGLSELTAELWFKPTAAMDDVASGQILIDVPDTFGDPIWRLSYGTLEPGLLSFEVATTSNWLLAAAGLEFPAGEWAHVAGVFDGEEAHLFVDGELVGWDWVISPPATVLSDNGLGLWVGRNHDGNAQLQGKIDEIRVQDGVAYDLGDVPFYPELANTADNETLLLLHLDEGQETPQDSAWQPHTIQLWGNPAWQPVCAEPVADGWRSAGLGDFHSCGIRPRGTVQCWGDEDDGQSDAPLGPFHQVEGGLEHTCGIRADGQPECWGCGNNDVGQCTPLNMTGDWYVDLAVGWEYSCALQENGTMSCWGQNSQGQLNDPGLSFEDITGGDAHVCGRTWGGDVICWGDNSHGQAFAPPLMVSYVAVDAGGQHTCAIRDSDGGVVCWGAGTAYADCVNNYDCGQAMPPLGAFEDISCGGKHSCALDGAGMVTCWGDDSWGQVSGAPNLPLRELSSGELHSCGVTFDGDMLCWGADANGQVGAIP